VTDSPADRPGVLIVLGDARGHGGLQMRYRMLAEHMATDGPVTILTWHDRPWPAWQWTERGILVVAAPAIARWDRDRPRAVETFNFVVALTTGVLGALLLARRWRSAAAGGLHPEGTVAGVAARLLGRPFVVDTWYPGPAGNVARLQRERIRPLVFWVLKGATAFVAGTREIAAELRAAGFPSARIETVRHGVDLGRFTPVPPSARPAARARLGLEVDVPVVAYWGRFDLRSKRLDLLRDAWRAAAVTGWRLVLAGDGPDSERVARFAAEVGAAVLPWLDDPSWLGAAADVFVLPPDFEETGLAMVEGVAMGLPGIVSATSGYLLEPPTGVLLVPNDVDDWARALRQLTSDDAARRRLGEAGRAWAESTHDFRHSVERMSALLRS